MDPQVDQLRALMAGQGLDAFLITDENNRRYLSGFTGSSGALLLGYSTAILVTDFRYYEQAAQQAPGWQLWKQTRDLDGTLAELLASEPPRRVGFEADTLAVASFERVKREAPSSIEWVPTEGVGRGLRAVKQPEEVQRLRTAQHIADQAAAHLPRLIQPGKREREVAWALHGLLRELGADDPAFDITVASGANSALPHYKGGERMIAHGEIVLVDFGARVGGYRSDMTRTFFTGDPPEKYREVYEVVLGAMHAAEAVLRPGFSARKSDQIARDWISDHGYGDYFGHSLGHGVGLEIHELPSLSFRAPEEVRLEAGNVVTVEPGIYLPGWGGVRIEDLVLITETGMEILSHAPTDIDEWARGQQ